MEQYDEPKFGIHYRNSHRPYSGYIIKQVVRVLPGCFLHPICRGQGLSMRTEIGAFIRVSLFSVNSELLSFALTKIKIMQLVSANLILGFDLIQKKIFSQISKGWILRLTLSMTRFCGI